MSTLTCMYSLLGLNSNSNDLGKSLIIEYESNLGSKKLNKILKPNQSIGAKKKIYIIDL